MKFSEKELYDLAELYYSPEELAILLEVDNVDLFIEEAKTPGTAIYKIIKKARLQTESDIRSNIFANAKAGIKEDIEKAVAIMNQKIYKEDEPKFE